MAVKPEALLSIEQSLSERLTRSWGRLSRQYQREVTEALRKGDPLRAQEIADAIDLSPIFDDNEKVIRLYTMAAFTHGASRLSGRPKDAKSTKQRKTKKQVNDMLAQFRAQIVGTATEAVKGALTRLIEEEMREDVGGQITVQKESDDVQKYDENQPRYPKGHPKGGQWKPSGNAGSKGTGGRYDSPGRKSFKDSLKKAFDPTEHLKDLINSQREHLQGGGHRGIRVDATLDGPKLSTDEMRQFMGMYPEASMEGFVLKQGEDFEVPDSPPDIDLMTPKECFSNAAQMTVVDVFNQYGEDLEYVEGFVMSPNVPFPIHHAWVTKKGTNTVIDPTLGWRPNSAYIGVRMTDSYVRKKLVQNGYYGIFTDGVMVNDIVRGTDEDFDYK